MKALYLPLPFVVFVVYVASFIFAYNASAHQYGPYKVGKPYLTASGKSFTPQEVKSLKQRGVASWYGKDFEGKMTANGGIFNSSMRTAAHRTLPMPSAVLIVNMTNGKMTVAIVNDRGPFSDTEGRLIDVSKQVAKDLDFLAQGRANVEIEYIPSFSQKLKNGEDVTQAEITAYIESKKMLPAEIVQNVNISDEFLAAKSIGKTIFNETRGSQLFYVQAGVFEVLSNAQELYKNLAQSVPSIQIRSEKRNAQNYYVVRSGPFETQTSAEASLAIIENICNDCNPMVLVI